MSEQHEAELVHCLAAVKERIRVACEQAGRDPAEVTLVGVSKTKPLADLQVAVAAGLNDLGENYVQEAVDKIGQWQGSVPVWHFIGPIQSNKTRQIAEHFDWVHSVDRLKIARRLSEQRPEEMAPLKVLVQVNISDDPAKAGVPVAEVAELVGAMAELPGLEVRGIMAIPALDLSEDELRRQFLQLKSLSDTLTSDHPGCSAISMGMSADFEMAIACGATHVRVGSAIFGARPAPPN
ncbi:MAG: YggS family pyridoxal phosphate-dependent enzyme [Saccharospirillum sp.]|nr:YggS family pyridoxal phosphate-dependent enzyme [Saccharospirillum sp.]